MAAHFFAQEIADLKLLAVFLDDRVDGEMGIHGTHFVLEALGDASDHVVDETLDSAQASDVLASTLPYSEGDFVGGAFYEADIHVDMADVLGERSTGTSDTDQPRFHGDLDSFGDGEFFGLEDVPHLQRRKSSESR